MTGAAEREARRGLARLRRALDKTARELELVETVLRAAEGAEFPVEAFGAAMAHLRALGELVDEQAERLEAKILAAGGISADRLRRGVDVERSDE